MKVQEVVLKTTQHFEKKGFSSPRLDAELLIAKGLKWKRLELYTRFDYPLGEEELALCRELVGRRSQGEPVAYITGQKEFFGHIFYVDSRVLIPRPDTEALVEAAIDFLKRSNLSQQKFKILDLGAGSGCIGLSLLKEFSNTQLMGLDISQEALAICQKNAEELLLSENCQWHKIDLLSQEADNLFSEEKFDLIVANPPYIDENDPHVSKEVKEFEPATALFAKDEGYECLKRWAEWSQSRLNLKGALFMELGWQQSQKFKKWLEENTKFTNIKIHKDLAGIERVIEAQIG